MKKNILLVLVIMFLTGCSGTVNIEFNENTITEKIVVTSSNTAEYSKIKNWNGFPLTKYYDQDLENPFSSKRESGVPYYDVATDSQNNRVTVSSTFSISEHQRSSLVRGCFANYNIFKKDANVTFLTSKGLTCNFYNFSVILKTPYKVEHNNATKVYANTNTYVWNVTKSQASKANIYIEINTSEYYNGKSEKDEPKESKQKETKEENTKTAIYILIIIVIGLFLTGLYLIKKKKENDRI